jgi:hypothetical protein
MLRQVVAISCCVALAEAFAPGAMPSGLTAASRPAGVSASAGSRVGMRPLLRKGRGTPVQMFWNPFDQGPSADEKRVAAKESIRELIKTGPKNGYGAPDSFKEKVSEACIDLIKLNPTKGQASSPLLDGDWELLYTSTPGASAGKLGPFIGDVEQRIDLNARNYDNVVKVGGGAVEAVLSARWEVPKDGKGNTWLVLFNDIKISVLGLPLVNKKFDQVGC